MPTRIVFNEAHQASLQEFTLPPLNPNSLLLRSRVSLISTGTELTIFNRRFAPGTHWDSWVQYPFQPGYATVAEVKDIGKNVTSLRIGQRVVARVPHASHHIVEENQVTCVPDAIANEEAVWFALAKIAFIGVLAADLRIGSRIAIIGAGPVGQMLVRWAAASALAEIVVVDRNESRLVLAAKGGATGTVAGTLEQKHETIIEAFCGHRPTAVFDCTSNPRVLAHALRLAADRGKVVILGDTGFPEQQCITSDVLLRGVSIVGAHDRYTLSDPQWSDDREIFRLYFQLVSTQRFSTAGLVTHRFDPLQAQEAYLLPERNMGTTEGILFEWQKK